MAYGSINVPGVTGPELEEVRKLARDARDMASEAVEAFSEKIYGETGVHGLRYYNDIFQVMNDSGEWVEIETGGGGLAPSNVIDPEIKIGNTQLTVSWGDPDDTIVEGQTLCTWKGTKLVQKVGSFPENVRDGVLLVDNQVKNAYKDNGFPITGLVNDVTYYYALFPYSDTGAVNGNEGNRLTGTPKPYRIMTVNVDLSNSNPETSVTYADDAVGMIAKSDSWDEFFGHYPVLLKNGVEVGKLKTTDFSKFEDGSAADITSGDAGDVMIAFPRRGLKISTVGTTLKVSMTDHPDDPDFKYYAHERGSARREVFYLGAYKGYLTSSPIRLRSLSGKTPNTNIVFDVYRVRAQANGKGYEESGFYQLTFRQAMYLLKYKNLNSQVALGKGYTKGGGVQATGVTNTKGMDYGSTSDPDRIKLFGLEDFFGNLGEAIDGVVSDSTRNILTATDNFNGTGDGYVNQGQGATADIHGFLRKPQGTTETGFLAKDVGGSETTYFCDYAYLKASSVVSFGSFANGDTKAGVFHSDFYMTHSSGSNYLGGRLMYL